MVKRESGKPIRGGDGGSSGVRTNVNDRTERREGGREGEKGTVSWFSHVRLCYSVGSGGRYS